VRGEVHVWRAVLPAPDAQADFGPHLSPDEWERARRYRFEQDRLAFVTARGIVRRILGRYLDRAPEDLRFVYGPHGKPEVEDAGDLRFNLAHSGERALFAVTRGDAVGVDIERHRPGVAAEAIAERFFSEQEAAALLGLAEHEREAAFFRCWTRKEAYVKAVATGIALGLGAFDVSVLPDHPPAILATRPDAREASRWSLYELKADPSYSAALAVEGSGHCLRCFDWPTVPTPNT
jgi:4'-phosphopantetheinyl transferase